MWCHIRTVSQASTLHSSMVATQEYLDAVAPLLARSPSLVTSLVAWVARLLKWYDLCWPTSRLLLLAAREPREKSQLPSYSLGRLPSEVIKGRLAKRGELEVGWSWVSWRFSTCWNCLNSNLLWKEDAMFRECALSLLLSIILCTTSVPKQPKGMGICLALQSCLLRSLEYLLHSCAYHICIYFIYIYGLHIQHIHTLYIWRQHHYFYMQLHSPFSDDINFHVSLKGDWIQCGFPFFEAGFWPSWCLPCCHGRRPPKIWVFLLRCVVVGAILMGRRMRKTGRWLGNKQDMSLCIRINYVHINVIHVYTYTYIMLILSHILMIIYNTWMMLWFLLVILMDWHWTFFRSLKGQRMGQLLGTQSWQHQKGCGLGTPFPLIWVHDNYAKRFFLDTFWGDVRLHQWISGIWISATATFEAFSISPGQDVVAVLAHLLLFTPAVAFPRLSACALAMAEAALQQTQGEDKIYLAAAVVVSVSQRLQKCVGGPWLRCSEGMAQMALPQLHQVKQDLECVTHLEHDLSLAATNARNAGQLSFFVYSRVLAASEHVNRAKEQYKRLVQSAWPNRWLQIFGKQRGKTICCVRVCCVLDKLDKPLLIAVLFHYFPPLDFSLYLSLMSYFVHLCSMAV